MGHRAHPTVRPTNLDPSDRPARVDGETLGEGVVTFPDDTSHAFRLFVCETLNTSDMIEATLTDGEIVLVEV
jgi:hypothetical protein